MIERVDHSRLPKVGMPFQIVSTMHVITMRSTVNGMKVTLDASSLCRYTTIGHVLYGAIWHQANCDERMGACHMIKGS